MRWLVGWYELYFFFQAEDGIRDLTVTGVQTCALPILPGVELDSEGAVEALDLAGCSRRGRLGEDVVDAILSADAVEQHFDRGLGVSASEDLSVVGQDLLRDSIAPER